MLASDVQQCESAISIHISPPSSFRFLAHKMGIIIVSSSRTASSINQDNKHKALSGILYLNIKTHRVSTVCLVCAIVVMLFYQSRIFHRMMTTGRV